MDDAFCLQFRAGSSSARCQDLRESKAVPESIEFAQQLAALPWRRGTGGTIEVLMVTSRISRHWLIPKGWPIADKSPGESARQEAYEEAGILGVLSRNPLGNYNYLKRLKDGSSIACTVAVYGLEVRELLDTWPEKKQRERRWFKPQDAATAVVETGLAQFLETVPEVLAHLA